MKFGEYYILTQDEKTVLEERAAAERLTVSKYIHKVLFG